MAKVIHWDSVPDPCQLSREANQSNLVPKTWWVHFQPVSVHKRIQPEIPRLPGGPRNPYWSRDLQGEVETRKIIAALWHPGGACTWYAISCSPSIRKTDPGLLRPGSDNPVISRETPRVSRVRPYCRLLFTKRCSSSPVQIQP